MGTCWIWPSVVLFTREALVRSLMGIADTCLSHLSSPASVVLLPLQHFFSLRFNPILLDAVPCYLHCDSFVNICRNLKCFNWRNFQVSKRHLFPDPLFHPPPGKPQHPQSMPVPSKISVASGAMIAFSLCDCPCVTVTGRVQKGNSRLARAVRITPRPQLGPRLPWW